jgi:Excalibur calcium-binding domain
VRYSALKRYVFIIVLMLPNLVFSHGGRTNAEGCHNNRKTGEYHCHGGASKLLMLKNSNSASGNEGSCGSKYLCKDMDSCNEAKYYLNECGLSRLDADNDGIPCESICGN